MAAAGPRKGVAAWNFTGARTALRLSGASWFYTWAAGPNGISAPAGVRLVPMIWGPGSVTSANLAEAQRHGHILRRVARRENSAGGTGARPAGYAGRRQGRM